MVHTSINIQQLKDVNEEGYLPKHVHAKPAIHPNPLHPLPAHHPQSLHPLCDHHPHTTQGLHFYPPSPKLYPG